MMKNRCLNPKADNYRHYGGRGILVCKRWMKFENFLADMGQRPAEMTLDRINSAKNYTLSNCRWAGKGVQMNNTRKNVFITFRGETRTLALWAHHIGIAPQLLWNRIHRHGWPVSRALTAGLRKTRTGASV